MFLSVVFFTVPICVLLSSILLCFVLIYCSVIPLSSTVLHCTPLYSTVLHCTQLRAVLHQLVLVGFHLILYDSVILHKLFLFRGLCEFTTARITSSGLAFNKLATIYYNTEVYICIWNVISIPRMHAFYNTHEELNSVKALITRPMTKQCLFNVSRYLLLERCRLTKRYLPSNTA